MQSQTLSLMFICTHNRCRSILCEAIARHLSNGRIAAFSAGSQPSREVHPDTILHLKQRDISISGLCSKSWDAHSDLFPDAVITVCDSAANEQCPAWLGQAAKVHWGLPDPSRVSGDSDDRAAAFDAVIAVITRRLDRLLEYNFEELQTVDTLREVLLHISESEDL